MGGSAHSLPTAYCLPPTLRTAFTLTEILVVISIIVLLLVLALPAFNWLTGARSIEGAQNTVAATLGRARGEAIGLQRDTGVLFFIDPASGRVGLAMVRDAQEEAPPTGVNVLLDLVPEREFLFLPPGVGAQVIDNVVLNASDDRQDDGYLGYNRFPTSGSPQTIPIGGVILFDGNGRLVSRTYAFNAQTITPVAMSPMYGLIYDANRDADAGAPPTTVLAPGAGAASAFGFVLYEREKFAGFSETNADVSDTDGDPLSDPQISGGTYGAANANPDDPADDEADEEVWLDRNAVPLLVNRFNGTLVRSE